MWAGGPAHEWTHVWWGVCGWTKGRGDAGDKEREWRHGGWTGVRVTGRADGWARVCQWQVQVWKGALGREWVQVMDGWWPMSGPSLLPTSGVRPFSVAGPHRKKSWLGPQVKYIETRDHKQIPPCFK